MSIISRGKEIIHEETIAKEEALIRRIRKNLSLINAVIKENTPSLFHTLRNLNIDQLFEELGKEHRLNEYFQDPNLPNPEIAKGSVVKIGWPDYGLFQLPLYVPSDTETPERIRDSTGGKVPALISKNIDQVQICGVYQEIRLFYWKGAWEHFDTGWGVRPYIDDRTLSCELDSQSHRIYVKHGHSMVNMLVIDNPSPSKIRDAVAKAYVSLFKDFLE